MTVSAPDYRFSSVLDKRYMYPPVLDSCIMPVSCLACYAMLGTAAVVRPLKLGHSGGQQLRIII